jgi:hypothetical protein
MGCENVKLFLSEPYNPQIIKGFAWFGERTLARELHSRSNIPADFSLHLSKFLCRYQTLLLELGAKAFDRALRPGRFDLFLWAITLRVMYKMPT